MSEPIPLVDYLQLEGEPRLVANECTACGARYFQRRNACAACFATDFAPVEISTSGVLRTFTIVSFAAPGIDVPYVAGIVDCDGTSVSTNIINVDPSPERVHTGMKVRLATYSLGQDTNGVEAIGFGYEPANQDERARKSQ